jgi:hypothetical protein
MKTLLRPLALSLLAGALALPALGQAAAPRPGGFAGKTGQDRRVALLVDGAGARVTRFRISYLATCEDGTTVNGRFEYTNLRIRRGRFSGRASDTRDFVGGRATSRVRLRGRFVSRRRAKGSWNAQITIRSGNTTHCSVSELRWSAHR